MGSGGTGAKSYISLDLLLSYCWYNLNSHLVTTFFSGLSLYTSARNPTLNMASGSTVGSTFLLAFEAGFGAFGSFLGLGGFSFLGFGWLGRSGKEVWGPAVDEGTRDGSARLWFAAGCDASSILGRGLITRKDKRVGKTGSGGMGHR